MINLQRDYYCVLCFSSCFIYVMLTLFMHLIKFRTFPSTICVFIYIYIYCDLHGKQVHNKDTRVQKVATEISKEADSF